MVGILGAVRRFPGAEWRYSLAVFLFGAATVALLVAAYRGQFPFYDLEVSASGRDQITHTLSVELLVIVSIVFVGLLFGPLIERLYRRFRLRYVITDLSSVAREAASDVETVCSADSTIAGYVETVKRGIPSFDFLGEVCADIADANGRTDLRRDAVQLVSHTRRLERLVMEANADLQDVKEELAQVKQRVSALKTGVG